MNKIIITLCEGQDDIAFLSRILYVNGYKKYGKKLKNFIKPFNELFLNKIKDKEIDGFGFIPMNYLVPSIVLYKENTYIFLHNLGGDNDSRGLEINKLINMYLNLTSDEDDFSSYDFKYKFLLFFDADEKGIQKREEEISQLIGKKLQHNKVQEKYGLYIFDKVLEDILIDLMKNGNETIFDDAELYIKKHQFDDSQRTKEYICIDSEEKYKGSSKFYEKKSLISIAGQLQFSAKSNSVIIEKSDYITKTDLLKNDICHEIAKLFSKD